MSIFKKLFGSKASPQQQMQSDYENHIQPVANALVAAQGLSGAKWTTVVGIAKQYSTALIVHSVGRELAEENCEITISALQQKTKTPVSAILKIETPKESQDVRTFVWQHLMEFIRERIDRGENGYSLALALDHCADHIALTKVNAEYALFLADTVREMIKAGDFDNGLPDLQR